MKKIFLPFVLLLAAFTSCTHEDFLEQFADSQPMPAPVLSRSITANTATIVGYSAAGEKVFSHNLRQTDAENNVWEWDPASNPPTQAKLENVQDLVCLVPAQTVNGNTFSVTPTSDGQLMWDKMSVSEQSADKKFYFNNVRHCLSKMCVEVKGEPAGKSIGVKYRPSGTFNCLTGEFSSVTSARLKTIKPTRDDDGVYRMTFSIVPQIFKKGSVLLEYNYSHSDYNQTYQCKMTDPDLVLKPNTMVHIHPEWKKDWTAGELIYKVKSVTLDKNEVTLAVGEQLQLIATVLPENAANKSVTWTSNNSSVVVDESGTMTVQDGAGSDATITVTTKDGGKVATCIVHVSLKIDNITTGTENGFEDTNTGGGSIEWPTNSGNS